VCLANTQCGNLRSPGCMPAAGILVAQLINYGTQNISGWCAASPCVLCLVSCEAAGLAVFDWLHPVGWP